MGISNQMYDEIMRSYERQRRINRELDLSCHDEVYKAIPELTEIDNEISKISLLSVTNSLEGDYNLDEANDKIKKLIAKKRSLISSSRFPSDYLKPHFSCPDCKDTGYIDRKPCHCLKQKMIEVAFNQSELQSNIRYCDFSNFSLDYYSAEKIDPVSRKSELELAKNALSISKEFVETFKSGKVPNSILFYGNVGTGKTFLSNCIAKELLSCGHSVIYFSATQLFDTLRNSRFSNGKENNDYEKIFSSDVLIIDDLGTENSTEFTLSQLFSCINQRMIFNKPMIISTNLNILDLKANYTERLSSRIYSSFSLVKFCGEDIRLRRKI